MINSYEAQDPSLFQEKRYFHIYPLYTYVLLMRQYLAAIP
jgi:hypothetical protein